MYKLISGTILFAKVCLSEHHGKYGSTIYLGQQWDTRPTQDQEVATFTVG